MKSKTSEERAESNVTFDPAAHHQYLLRLGDTALVLGHRLSEWCGHGPEMEEDLALANIALDLIGQARLLLAHAAKIEGAGRDEDALAFLRDGVEYRNLLLAELPNGDFAHTIVRQCLYDAYAVELYAALEQSGDPQLAGVAGKGIKEHRYHLRHTSGWVVRLGDGTEESHARTQRALDELWPYTGELFEMDELEQSAAEARIGVDLAPLRPAWDRTIDAVLEEATLTRPENGWMQAGGKRGQHSEHLGHMLAEMQYLPRAHPGARW